MTPFTSTNRFTVAALVLVLASTGCGGGGGGSDGGTGTLTLSITDAPVDGAAAVVVEFTGVELKPVGGSRVVFDFDTPRQIDLLALQGGASEPLLDGVEVPAGDYSWIRLAVNAESGVLDSYVELVGGARVSLFIPSGAQTGLKLQSGFTVAQGGIADFTIDFNLRKSVHDPVGQPDFFLRPALRLVDNLEVGSVSGTVSADLVTDESCTNGVDHDMGNAVYLYAGFGAVVDDEGSANAPLASAIVTLDPDTQEYRYEIGFVAAGPYTVAFTCQAADDDPVTDDQIAFVGAADVAVTAGADTVHDF
jgi:hypothetical protein